MTRWLIPIIALLVIATASNAQETLSEAEETRAVEIGKTLRCVVCQNQSIEDSSAPIAGDMRRVVRNRVKAGDSDAEVRDYLRSRYGDFVLMKPPFQWNTVILWATPFILIVLAGGYFMLRSRDQREPQTEQALSAEERKRIANFLASDGDETK